MENINYEELFLNSNGLLTNINYKVSLLSNASALLNSYLKDCNWVGFYLVKNNKLILGPFQGNVACLEIPFNKGVCGYCATKKETIVVENVHEFKSHIACDSRSNSEIVVPIFLNNELYGVLDIDSYNFSNFNENDKLNLEKFVKILENNLAKTLE